MAEQSHIYNVDAGVAHRYSTVAIILHWLIAALIIGQLISGILMVEFLPRASSLTFEIYQVHKSFGITILLLSLMRVLWRLFHRPPPLPVTMKLWEKAAAKFTHILFYALMIGLPLVGWAMVSVSPLDIQTVLFKTIPWPHLPFWTHITDRDILEGLESFFKQVHEIMGFTMIALLVIHIGAAFKHQFIDRDSVLSHMLPFIRVRNGNE